LAANAAQDWSNDSHFAILKTRIYYTDNLMPGTLIIRPLILLLLLTPGIATVSASPFTTQVESIRLAVREGVTLDQAVARVKQQTKGQILTAETIQRKGKPVHRIKVLLPSGSVRVMYVDAE